MGESADAYMLHAEHDLANANLLSGDSQQYTDARAFHSQQAAEKAIKALLAATGTDPESTHDILELAGYLRPEQNTGASDSDLQWLSRYAVMPRYAFKAVPKSDADRALDVATSVVNTVRSQM